MSLNPTGVRSQMNIPPGQFYWRKKNSGHFDVLYKERDFVICALAGCIRQW